MKIWNNCYYAIEHWELCIKCKVDVVIWSKCAIIGWLCVNHCFFIIHFTSYDITYMYLTWLQICNKHEKWPAIISRKGRIKEFLLHILVFSCLIYLINSNTGLFSFQYFVLYVNITLQSFYFMYMRNNCRHNTQFTL